MGKAALYCLQQPQPSCVWGSCLDIHQLKRGLILLLPAKHCCLLSVRQDGFSQTWIGDKWVLPQCVSLNCGGCFYSPTGNHPFWGFPYFETVQNQEGQLFLGRTLLGLTGNLRTTLCRWLREFCIFLLFVTLFYILTASKHRADSTRGDFQLGNRG